MAGADGDDANQKLQERLSRPPENWEDVIMAALVGDPVFYGVLASITVCVLAFIGLLAAKVLIDQIEEEEQKDKRREEQALREQQEQQAGGEDDEPEGKKHQ